MHQRLLVYSGYICSCWGMENTWCVRYCIGIALQGSSLATKNVPMTPFLVGCMYLNDLCRHWHDIILWEDLGYEPENHFKASRHGTWSPGHLNRHKRSTCDASRSSEIGNYAKPWLVVHAHERSRLRKNHVITSTKKNMSTKDLFHQPWFSVYNVTVLA